MNGCECDHTSLLGEPVLKLHKPFLFQNQYGVKKVAPLDL